MINCHEQERIHYRRRLERINRPRLLHPGGLLLVLGGVLIPHSELLTWMTSCIWHRPAWPRYPRGQLQAQYHRGGAVQLGR